MCDDDSPAVTMPNTTEPGFETLYAELRRLARREVFKGGAAGQMSATTRLHEAYLRCCACCCACF